MIAMDECRTKSMHLVSAYFEEQFLHPNTYEETKSREPFLCIYNPHRALSESKILQELRVQN